MRKIVLIVPYFGKMPTYFELWMLSASYNKSIDFVILTDNEIKCDSKNIKVIRCCFDEVKENVESYGFKLQSKHKTNEWVTAVFS